MGKSTRAETSIHTWQSRLEAVAQLDHSFADRPISKSVARRRRLRYNPSTHNQRSTTSVEGSTSPFPFPVTIGVEPEPLHWRTVRERLVLLVHLCGIFVCDVQRQASPSRKYRENSRKDAERSYPRNCQAMRRLGRLGSRYIPLSTAPHKAWSSGSPRINFCVGP